MTTSASYSRIALEKALIEKQGLSAFVRLAWPTVEPGEYRHGWHIDLICTKLEQFYAGNPRKLVIMVPPGSMKTLLTGVFGPAFVWTKTPSTKFIYSTYGGPLALKAARQMRDLVGSKWFQDRWPDVHIPYQNTNAAAFFENNRKGFRFSGSRGGEVTGRHANIIVGDDLNKAQDSLGSAGLNLTGLDASWEYWSKVLPSRQVDPKTTRRLLIGQRLHEYDVPGRWIEEDPDVEVLCLPMRYEPDHQYLHPEDARTEPGELLWPDHIPETEVLELERMGSMVTAAQLQQRPSPIGGAVFRRDWCGQLWTRLPTNATYIQSWDMTFGSVGANASWVVGQVWAHHGAHRYLVDQTRAQVEYPAMRDMVRTLSAKHPQCATKLVEDKAAGKPLVQDLRNEISGLVEVKVSSSSGGKLARAQAVTGLWEAGNVWLPHPTDARLANGMPMPSPWVHDFVERLCRFKGAPSDVADEVDAMSQALNYIERFGGAVDWADGADVLREHLRRVV